MYIILIDICVELLLILLSLSTCRLCVFLGVKKYFSFYIPPPLHPPPLLPPPPPPSPVSLSATNVYYFSRLRVLLKIIHHLLPLHIYI